MKDNKLDDLWMDYTDYKNYNDFFKRREIRLSEWYELIRNEQVKRITTDYKILTKFKLI